MGTRDVILQNAFILFLQKGFSVVSVNDILAKTGITKGGFYHYYKSKDALILEAIDQYIRPFFEEPIYALKQAFDENNEPFSAYERLQHYYIDTPEIGTWLLSEEERKTIKLRDFHFLVFEGMKKYAYLQNLRCKFYKEKLSLLTEILKQGIKEGSIHPALDASEWATTIIALKDGILSLNLLDETIDIHEKYKISFYQLWQEMKAK